MGSLSYSLLFGISSHRLLRERRQLKVNTNVLVRKTTNAEQIIIPSSLRWLSFQEFHQNMAHLGPERAYKLAKERVYWPNMENDIRHFIDHKCPCLASRKTHVIPQAPIGTVTANATMDINAIDFLKVDRAAVGYEYILIAIDQFTKYAQLYATTNKSAKTFSSSMTLY